MSMPASEQWSQQDADAAVENLLGLWTSGGTMAEALGLDSRECEALYAHGHSLYAQGKYNDALKIFAQLVAYDHLDSRYQMALASAMQMTRRYEEALQHYIIVTVMRMDDPVPVYHSAECLIAMGRPDEARESLELVGTLCEEGRHDVIKTRAQAMLKALEAKAPDSR